jgi:hypothetical protein
MKERTYPDQPIIYTTMAEEERAASIQRAKERLEFLNGLTEKQWVEYVMKRAKYPTINSTDAWPRVQDEPEATKTISTADWIILRMVWRATLMNARRKMRPEREKAMYYLRNKYLTSTLDAALVVLENEFISRSEWVKPGVTERHIFPGLKELGE